MTFSSTCCMVFIGLSTTDTSGGFHSLQFHETTDKQASIQYMSHNDTTASLHKNQVEQTVVWPREYHERNHLLDLRQGFGGRMNEAYPGI